jgi:hypothetical protein
MPNEKLEPGLESVGIETKQTQETNVEADERAYESTEDSRETFLEKQEVAAPSSVKPAAPTASVQKAVVKDETLIRVEKIMEKDLGSFYTTLPPAAQSLFKKKGEEAANEISAMIRSFKVKVGKVLRLIRDWLHTIPGVNRYFLEQEAKIKTDLIMEMAEATKDDSLKQP